MALDVCHWNCSNFLESFSAHYQDSSQISFHIFHLLGSNFWFSPCTLVSHQSQAETSLHQLHFSPLYIWFRAPATARSNSSQPANVMATMNVTMTTMTTMMVTRVRKRWGSLYSCARWDWEATKSQEYSGGKPGLAPGNFPPFHSVFLEILSRILDLLLGKQTRLGRNSHIRSYPKCPRKAGFLESSCFHILILFHTSC